MIEEDKNRLSYRPTPAVSIQQVDAAEKAAEKAKEESASLLEFTEASFEEDQMLSYFLQDNPDFAPDEDWAEQLNMETYQELTKDIPEDFHGFLDDTVSLEHAKATREYVLRSLENEKKMASWGWSGVPLRMALTIADPVAIGATVVTEGVAAPLIWGSKLSRIGRVVRGATAGAASNAAIEGYIASQSATRDEYDVLFAASAGAILGGGLGAFNFGKKQQTDDPTVQAHENHMRAVEEAQAQDIAANARQTLLGEDRSVGAAQDPLSPAALMKPIRNGVDELDNDDMMQDSLFGMARIDMVGRLLQSENPFFNRLGQILGEDAVGVRVEGGGDRRVARKTGEGTVNIESTADIMKTNMMKGTFSKFYQVYKGEYETWVKSERKGILKKYRLSNRQAFGELVADAIENPSGVHHPAVKRMAQRNAQLYAELLDEAKAAGVKGFESIPKNLTYFTHRWNKQKFQDMRDVVGDEGIISLLKTGLIRGTEDLTDEAAEAIAKTMYTKIRSDTAGLDAGFSRLFTAESRDTLKDIMLEEKFGKMDKDGVTFKEFSEEEIDRLLDLFKQKERGLPSAAKGRLRFDMETTIPWGGKTLSLKQLQDRDAEQVFTLYASEMTGRIALAKKGIKSQADFNKLVNDGRAYAENEGFGRYKGGEDGMNKEAEIAQVMYNLLIGRRPHPQYDPNSTPMKITRLIQDYNFLRLMGQVGWAQFAELGNAHNVNGFRAMLRAVPEYRKMLKRATDGQLEDPVLRDIEAFYGTGSDRMINQMINRLDYVEVGTPTGSNKFMGVDVGKTLNKAQVRTDQLKRVQADISGMAPITLMLERGTARVVAQTLADLAFENASLSMKRLNSLGLGKQTITKADGSTEVIDYAELVFKAIKDHATVEKSFLYKAKKLRELNLEKWPPDAREAFGVALSRWTRRTIQQNDVGNLSLFMTKPWGQVISQFRTFQIVSHSKQLLHNLSMNDTRAYLAMTFSSMTAGAA